MAHTTATAKKRAPRAKHWVAAFTVVAAAAIALLWLMPGAPSSGSHLAHERVELQLGRRAPAEPALTLIHISEPPRPH